MIKAIFLDIDGTLISGKRPSIKKEVIEGLKQVRKKGIQLFIASGRHMLELEELKLVEQFEFDGYLLLNGGYCTIGSQIIYDNKIAQEDLKEIVKIVKENNYPCLFIESNQMYITHVNQRVIDAQASISTMIPPISNQINIDNIYQVDPYVDEKGIKEIVITGIHIASYGKDFDNNYRLIDLLEDLDKIDGIERIRLGSLEPTIVTKEFAERLSKLDSICNQFHLSLQSGCDETLKRMNRRYTTEQFKEIVRLLRNAYSDVNLTTDIIVGFPGETDEEFNKTYQFLKEIKFYKMHVFKYSPRKGTKASVMLNQINGDIKEERSKKLIELSDRNEIEYNNSYIGKNVEVLFEEEKDGMYKGHTQNYIMVYCQSKENLDNKIMDVVCEKAEKEHIIAIME